MDLHTRFAVALALIAIIFPTTFSAPAVPQSCSPTCRRNQDLKLQYQEGKSYVYAFETEVVTQVEDSSDESSRIKVKGQAILAAQSSCDFVLTLQQVAIQSPSGQAISRIDDIEGSSVRFAYQDGVIESICLSDSDSTWSANIKRAVVSLLSNKADKITGDAETIEDDISGRCPTTYKISGNKYTKSKDLNSCTNRVGGASVSHGVPYEVSSKANTIPIVNSVLNCEQVVNNGVFQTVSCVEDHKLAPMAQKSGVVHTLIKSSLNLLNTQDGLLGAKSNVPTVPSNIFYDYAEVEEVQRQKSAASNAVDLLNRICSEIETGTISSKVPGLFLQLKKAVKYARKDDLKLMYGKITSGDLCQNAREKLEKLYLDATALAASDGSIAFVAEVIADGQVSEETRASFQVYTTFAVHPGVQSLEAMDKLISKSDVESEFLLTASGLAHQYCRNTNPKCLSSNEYYALVNKIVQHVRVVNDEEEIERVIAALQALGNVDQLTPEATSAIIAVLDNESASSRLKIRALDAYRRDPCQEQLKQKALEKLANNRLTSEVRIQAYLALARCVQQRDIDGIQKVLSAEKSNQVGSFIQSHIWSVLKSASPGTQILKSAFRQLSVSSPQPFDPRIYSRHEEISAFTPELNVGFSAEGNIIFSQDSYVPRSLGANVTFDAFGRSYNLFEFGGYLEGYEQVVERLFGPKGELTKVTFNDIVKDSKNRWASFVGDLKNRVRREVQTEADLNAIQDLQSRVKIDPNYSKEPITDVYLRVLGTTIMVESASDTNDKKSLSVRLLRGMEKIVEGAREHKCDLTEPILFLDDEVVLSTIAGLPLNLNVEGTSILSLQMQGNFDLNALIRGDSTDMKARVIPSAATLLKAKMSIGTGPIESGIQLEGKVHTASGIDIKIVTEQGKVEIRANMPQDKIQLIDIRSDLYWVEQAQDQLEKKTPLKSNVPQKVIIDSECTTALSKSLGLKLCADVKAPQLSGNSLPLLSGSSVLSVSIEKVEPSMEGYYLKIATNTEDNNNLELDVILDTPGSRTNRKISATAKYLNYRSATPQVKLELDSPYKKLSVDYKRSNTDDLKGANIKIVNDGETYTGIAEIKKTKVGSDKVDIEPLIQYSLPSGAPVNLLEGKISKETGKKYTVDLRTGGPTRSLRGQLSGSVQLDKPDDNHRNYIVKDLKLESESLGKLFLDGSIGLTDNEPTTYNLVSKYGQTAQYQYSISGKAGQTSGGKRVFQVTSRSDRRQFLNFDLDSECSHTSNSWENFFKYTRGLEESTKVVISQQARVVIDSYKKFDLNNELRIVHPDLNIDVDLKTAVKSKPEERNADIVLKAGNTVNGAIKYNSAGGDYSLKADAQVSGKSYEFSEVSTKTNEELRTFNTRIAVTPGFWYEAHTDLTHRNLKDNIKGQLNTKITSDQLSHPIVFKSGVGAKKDSYGALIKVEAKGENYVHIENEYKIKPGKLFTVSGKAYVKDYLDSSLSQTISRPASDLKLTAKWVPSGRVIHIHSDVKIEGDLHTLNADIKWDADRDPTRAASLQSSNNIDLLQLSIDSKSEITILGQHTELNLKGKVAKELLNGEHSLAVSVKTNEGKTYTVTATNELERHSNSQSSKLHLKVELPDTAPYQLDWENRGANFDTKECTFEILSNLKVSYSGNKNLNLHSEISSLIPGNYRSLAGQFEASGNVIEKTVGLEFKTDVKTGHVDLSASGKRGNRKGDVQFTLDVDRHSPKKRLQIDYKLNTPFETLTSVAGSLKYGFFFESWRNFEVSDHGSVKVNQNSQYSWDSSFILLENELKAIYGVNEDNEAVIQLKANGKLIGKKVAGSASSIVRGQKSEVNIDADFELPNVEFKITGQTTVESLKKFELKINHKTSNADQSSVTEVLAKINDKRAKITNKLDIFPQRKSINLTLSVKDQPVRQIFLSLAETQTDTWQVEANGRWGEGVNYLNSKGTVLKSGDTFDMDINLDSPALNANNWSVRISKKLVSGRHSIALSAESANKKMGALSVDYAKKFERSGDLKTYDGSVKVERGEVEFSGNFRVEDALMDKTRDNGEEGRKISGNVNFSSEQFPLKMTFLAKRSNLEKRLKASFCSEVKEGECKIADIHLRHDHKSNGDFEYKFRAAVETSNEGQVSDVNAIVVGTVSTDSGRQFENTAQLILGEEKKHPIGYRVYRTKGEIGAEILLPQRVIATVLSADLTSDSEMKADLSFYIDKTKQPNRKINIHVDSVKKSDSHAKERKLTIVFHHPELAKDMKVVSQYSYKTEQESRVFDGKLVLDIFEANKDITVGYKVDMHKLDQGWEAQTLASIVSKGQNINVVSKGVVSRTENQLSYRSEIEYENRNRQIKSSKIAASLSRNRIHIQVDSSDSKVLAFSANWEKHATGYEIREEIYLPGMEDTRTIQTKVTTVSPPHIEWKTYTSSSSPGQYYEVFVGFKNTKHFVAGLYDHETQGVNVLADFNVALNTSRVLFVKTNWDMPNIRKVVTKAQNRMEKTIQRLKELSLTSGKETVKEIKHVASSLRTAIPNLKAVCDSYKKQLTDLKTELEADEDTRQLIDYYDFVHEFTQEHIQILSEIVASIKIAAIQVIESLQAQAEHLPHILEKILEKLPVTVEAFNEGLDATLDAITECCKGVMRAVWDTVDRISEKSPAFAEKLTWLAESSVEIGKVVQKSLVIALERLTKVWAFVKESSDDILENPIVKDIIKELIVRYKNFLAELIKDAKDQAEEFRKYILTILPGEEIQELVASIVEYVEKKARQSTVDDIAAQKEIYNKLVKAVKKIAHDIFTIDLANGLFIAQIPLPKSVDNLTDIVQAINIEWNKIRTPSLSLSRVPSVNYGFTEAYNKLKAAASIQSIVPPFRPVALIMGSQYYKTFDNKFYHFEGNCQYLLASDFVEKTFNIVLDYDNTGSEVQNSVILTYGEHSVAIKPDRTVVVDGVPSEVDNVKTVGKILVINKPTYILLLGEDGAVTLGCSKNADVCVVTINGYYQGKVAGLLGTFNNEQFDDFRAVDGKIENDVEHFAAQWKLGQCSESSIPEHSDSIPSSVKSKCADVFEGRNSSLRPCYGVIDTKQYKQVCEQLTTEKGFDLTRSVCTAAEGYGKSCFIANAQIELPKECIRSV